MKTIDTMNLHMGIDSKWNTIKTFFTSHTAKTLSMKWFTRCTKNLKMDRDIRRRKKRTFFIVFTRSVIGREQAAHFSNEF